MPIPPAFDRPSALEAKLFDELENVANNAARRIRIVPEQGTDSTIRGAFLRWFLLEALASNVASVAHIEIERATFTGALNLEARTVNVLLRFIECTFDQMIEMSDATIVGFDMVGGSATEIVGDRLTVKGSMRLRAERKPIQRNGPHLTMLRLCGADIRGNLDMRGCLLGVGQSIAQNGGSVVAKTCSSGETATKKND
jgi:hypothetical protein